MTMTIEELYRTVVLECAELPVDKIASGLRQFSAVRKTELATTARLLAAGRKLMPREQWKEWAVANSGLTRSECYHRAKAGDLLIAFQDRKVLYKKLLRLSGDKLLALSQLPPDAVEGFLAVTDVGNMRIAEVRLAVKCELCRMEHRAGGTEPDCGHCPFQQLKEDREGSFDEALDLIWNMDEEAFLSGVKSDDAAAKCAGNGVNLLAAALEYEKDKIRGRGESTFSTANLLQIKAALLDGIRDIEMLIAGSLDKEEKEDDEISEDDPRALCGDHTETGCGGGPARAGKQCGDHTVPDRPGGSGLPGKQCGDHTPGTPGFDRNGEQTVCHSEPAPDHRIRRTSGSGQGGSPGAAEVPAVCSGTQAPHPADARSAGGDAGRPRPGGGVSDPPRQRSEGKVPADLSELPELDPEAPGVPEG